MISSPVREGPTLYRPWVEELGNHDLPPSRSTSGSSLLQAAGGEALEALALGSTSMPMDPRAVMARMS